MPTALLYITIFLPAICLKRNFVPKISIAAPYIMQIFVFALVPAVDFGGAPPPKKIPGYALVCGTFKTEIQRLEQFDLIPRICAYVHRHCGLDTPCKCVRTYVVCTAEMKQFLP